MVALFTVLHPLRIDGTQAQVMAVCGLPRTVYLPIFFKGVVALWAQLFIQSWQLCAILSEQAGMQLECKLEPTKPTASCGFVDDWHAQAAVQ